MPKQVNTLNIAIQANALLVASSWRIVSTNTVWRAI